MNFVVKLGSMNFALVDAILRTPSCSMDREQDVMGFSNYCQIPMIMLNEGNTHFHASVHNNPFHMHSRRALVRKKDRSFIVLVIGLSAHGSFSSGVQARGRRPV